MNFATGDSLYIAPLLIMALSGILLVLAEAFYTGKITEKKNGVVMRDITTKMTETGQVYVMIPVPARVKAAIKPTHQPASWTLTPKDPPAPVAAAPTPRRARAPAVLA